MIGKKWDNYKCPRCKKKHGFKGLCIECEVKTGGIL